MEVASPNRSLPSGLIKGLTKLRQTAARVLTALQQAASYAAAFARGLLDAVHNALFEAGIRQTGETRAEAGRRGGNAGQAAAEQPRISGSRRENAEPAPRGEPASEYTFAVVGTPPVRSGEPAGLQPGEGGQAAVAVRAAATDAPSGLTRVPSARTAADSSGVSPAALFVCRNAVRQRFDALGGTLNAVRAVIKATRAELFPDRAKHPAGAATSRAAGGDVAFAATIGESFMIPPVGATGPQLTAAGVLPGTGGRTATVHNDTSIGAINITTRAADADGIMRDARAAAERRFSGFGHMAADAGVRS